jgi:hypothetical protein
MGAGRDEGEIMRRIAKVESAMGLGAACVLGSMLLFGPPARAQQPLTVDEIRVCTCAEQAMAVLRQRNDDAHAAYEAQVQRDLQMSRQIEQLRATMNPADLDAQDQLREMIDIRTRLEQDMREKYLPAWQNATRRLNDVVSRYNAACVGRPIYKIDDAEAKKNLVCPAVAP